MRILPVLMLTGMLSLTVITGKAQNYIGMHKDKIIETMKVSHKRLKLNTEVVNPHYNYLKFEDRISEITFLFFLSEKDICTNVRETYSYSNINDVIAELNRKYTPKGDNRWVFKEGGKKYLVLLTEKEWYFTVKTNLDE